VFFDFLVIRQRSLIALDACGGAHHWARTLQALGHEVKLLPAKHVRLFVLRDKADVRDAQSTWVAAQQLHIKALLVKNEQQQACLVLHRMRAQLMKECASCKGKSCVGLAVPVRSIVLREGHRVLLQRVQDELAKAQEQVRLPGMVVTNALWQPHRIDRLHDDIEQLDKRLASMVKQRQHMQAPQAMLGIKPLTATVLVAISRVARHEKGARYASRPGCHRRARCASRSCRAC